MGYKNKTGDDETMDFDIFWCMVVHICHAAQKTTSLLEGRSEVEKTTLVRTLLVWILTTKFEYILTVPVTQCCTSFYIFKLGSFLYS